MNKYFNYRNYF